MPEFKYKAKDAGGKTVTGKKYALSNEDLIVRLERKNLTVVSVKEAPEKKNPLKDVFSSLKIGYGRVTVFELVVLCRQLATMLQGGVPILNAIKSIAGEVRNPALKEVLEGVGREVTEGKGLSESLAKYPRVFSALFLAIVEAGEKVGALDDMLIRLSRYLESRDRLVKKMRSATTYPAFIAGFFTLAIAAITLFIIPKFQGIYESFGAELPGLTLFLFKISSFFVKNIFSILIIFIVTFFSLFLFIKNTKKGRTMFDKTLLGLPMFGEVIKKAAISKFCRTLSTLLAQGVSVTEALFLVGKTSGNIIIEEASIESGKLVTEGETIPAAFTKMKVFPPLMLQMVSVGVDSGSLPELLDKTADFYEEEVDTFANTLTTMIEPILVVSLGAVIAVVVLALYMPIFKLGSAMGGGH
ncbi:MAG: type II secretion system F family protein [Candidatus Omnitrophota bacterium]